MGIDLIMNRLPFILIFKTIYRKSSDISMLKGIWFYLLDFIMAVGIALSNFFFLQTMLPLLISADKKDIRIVIISYVIFGGKIDWQK